MSKQYFCDKCMADPLVSKSVGINPDYEVKSCLHCGKPFSDLPTNLDEELDRILMETYKSVSYKTRAVPLPETPYGAGGDVDCSQEIEYTKHAIVSLVQSICLSVIDTPVNLDPQCEAYLSAKFPVITQAHEELRVRQRQSLKEKLQVPAGAEEFRQALAQSLKENIQ